MSINLQFDEDRRAVIEQNWVKWWDGELGRPIVVIQQPSLSGFTPQQEFTKQFLLETPVDEMVDYFQSRLESTRYYADALPMFRVWFGPAGISGFLGSKMEPVPEHNTVWCEADEPIPFEDLHFTYDPDNVWWRRALELTTRLVDRWSDKVSLGHPSHSGILDVLACFRTTQQLLYDLYEAPDEVIRLSKDITDLWIRYYEEWYEIGKKTARGTMNWGGLWSPGGTLMHQCDFSCMISPKMFERFVMPDLERCIRRTDYAFYHLDGKGAIPHLDMLLSLETLRGIQWIPGAGQPQASDWISLLKRIKDGGKLCQVFVDPGGARHIVRELGGRGFALIIVSPEPMPAEEADDFLAVLAAEDADAI